MFVHVHCGCGRDNNPWRRFCGGCGTALGLACAACGFANELGDRFCGGCGTVRRTTGSTAAPKPRTTPPKLKTIPIEITQILSEADS